MTTSIQRITKLFNVLFALCIAALMLGQFALISRGTDVKLYMFDLAVSTFSFVGLCYLLFFYKKLILPGYFLLFLAFSFVASISLVANLHVLKGTQAVTAAFYLARWVIYSLAGLVTFNLLGSNKLSSKFVLTTLMYSGLFLSVTGFIQLYLLPDFGVLDPVLGWDPHKNRLAATFFDPNFTGGYLALCLGLFLIKYFYDTSWSKKAWVFFFTVPLAALLLTFSRSSWGMFAVIVLLLGVFKSRLLLILAILLMFLTYFAVPRVQTRLAGITDPSDSAAFRLTSWQNAYTIAQDNLFLGVGYNAFKYAQEDYGFLANNIIAGNSATGADSSFLLVFATTGITGLVVFLLLYFYPAFKSTQLLVLLSGLFVQAQFVNALFYPPILFLWVVLLANFLFEK